METATEASAGKSRVMSKREKMELFASLWQLAYHEAYRQKGDAKVAIEDSNSALAEFKKQVFGASP